MNVPIIKRPQRPTNAVITESTESISSNQIKTVDDAILHYAKPLELAPQLLDILINQRYEVDNLQSLAERQKIDLLSHLTVAKTIAELNDLFTKYPPRQALWMSNRNLNKTNSLEERFKYLVEWVEIIGNALEGVEVTTIGEIGKNILKLTEKDIDGLHGSQIADILKELGYERKKRAIEGKEVRVWAKPTEETSDKIDENTLTEVQNETNDPAKII